MSDRLKAVSAVHTSNINLSPNWCSSCHQLRPCDAQELAEEAIQLRADLEAARGEIAKAQDAYERIADDRDGWRRQYAQSRATEAELRARIVRHHDTTIMARLQSGVRCPACALDAQEPRT